MPDINQEKSLFWAIIGRHALTLFITLIPAIYAYGQITQKIATLEQDKKKIEELQEKVNGNSKQLAVTDERVKILQGDVKEMDKKIDKILQEILRRPQ